MKDQSYSKSNKEKTPREKKRSSRRPILHGIFASEMLLPWERRRDLLGLYEKFRYELRPEGASEEEVVLDYTWLHWLKRRAFRAVQFSFQRDPFALELANSGKKTARGIQKYLNEQAHDQGTLLGSHHEMMAAINQSIIKLARTVRNVEEDDAVKAEEIQKRLEMLVTQQREHILPMMERLHALYNEEKAFQRAYLPEDLERVARFVTILDARIDKALGRLVALKEYAKLYGHKSRSLLPNATEMPSGSSIGGKSGLPQVELRRN